MKLFKNLFYLITVLGLGFALTSATTDQTRKKKEFITFDGGKTFKINQYHGIKIPFSYKVKSGRKLVVSLHDSDGEWLVGKSLELEKGSGKIDVVLGNKHTPVRIGKDYKIKYHIRKVGDEYTWKDAIDISNVKGISTKK